VWERSDRLAELRDAIERFPRHAALKHVARVRGVPLREDVRRPLRPLTPVEATALDEAVAPWLDPE
jgi:dihydrodipicolinate synthase/N-acetylneuraminate lyase